MASEVIRRINNSKGLTMYESNIYEDARKGAERIVDGLAGCAEAAERDGLEVAAACYRNDRSDWVAIAEDLGKDDLGAARDRVARLDSESRDYVDGVPPVERHALMVALSLEAI